MSVKRTRRAVSLLVGCALATSILAHGAEPTEATFSDAEFATSAPLTAGTVGSPTALGCQIVNVILIRLLRLNWTAPTNNTVPVNGYTVTWTNATTGAVVFTMSPTTTTVQVELTILQVYLAPNTNYVIRVYSRNTATGWTSVTPSNTVTVRNSTPTPGWACPV